MPAARSVNCRRQPTTLRRETDALKRPRPTADPGVMAGLGPAIYVFSASKSLLTANWSPRRADALLVRTDPFKRIAV